MCADQTLCRHPRPDWEMRSWKPTIAVVGEGAKGLQCRQQRLAQLKRNDRWKIGKYIKKTKITFGCRCNSLISTQIRFFHHSASHIPSMSKSSGRHVCVQTQKCRLSSSAGVFAPNWKKKIQVHRIATTHALKGCGMYTTRALHSAQMAPQFRMHIHVSLPLKFQIEEADGIFLFSDWVEVWENEVRVHNNVMLPICSRIAHLASYNPRIGMLFTLQQRKDRSKNMLSPAATVGLQRERCPMDQRMQKRRRWSVGGQWRYDTAR